MGDDQWGYSKVLKDGIKRVVITELNGSATYREIARVLKTINLEPTEKGLLEGISDIIFDPDEHFKLIVKNEELGIECTEILKTLGNVSLENEEFLFTKRKQIGFKIEVVKKPQE